MNCLTGGLEAAFYDIYGDAYSHLAGIARGNGLSLLDSNDASDGIYLVRSESIIRADKRYLHRGTRLESRSSLFYFRINESERTASLLSELQFCHQCAVHC